MKKLTLFLIMLFSATIWAQDLPRIAVYVTGDIHFNERNALGTRILSSLINSGRYKGIERSGAFLAAIEKEQAKQRSGDVDDSQISELGKMFGVKYVCIAAIIPAFGSKQISARIVDVETAEIAFIGEAYSPLRMIDDFTRASDEVVIKMFGGQAKPEEKQALQIPERTTPAPKPTPSTKPPKSSPKPSFWVGIGLEAVGAGLFIYGLVENGNVVGYDDKGDLRKAENSAKTRNVLYGIGASALLAGISIHIIF